MRLTALFFTASLVAFAAHAGPGDTIKAYPAEQVAPDTWVITGPLGEPSVENQGFMNNPAWIIAGNQVIVIDPGSSVQAGRMVVKAIQKTTGLPVTAVYNTHIHGDHWLGNQAILEAWPKAVLIAHPDMIAKAKAGEAESWVKLMSNLTQGYTDGTRAEIPTLATTDGMVSKHGNRSFKIHSSNDAHSKTDIMIEVDNGVLFTGDNVLNQRIARMDDGTFMGNIKAIDRALTLPVKVVVPGHGNSGSVAMLKAQRNYFQTLFDAVKVEYDAGKSDFEMKPSVVKKLAAYQNWHGFDAAVGKQISLAVLEIEQQ
ncbi:MAG: MBL fold metallo-hydrolase [Thiobacillus sp.]|nr:MBL fold metallo-hydrolase [Thiobacillus sp.]MDP3124383.1 MBL fold metallo-hydrolase [Thiobacillus sp.]